MKDEDKPADRHPVLELPLADRLDYLIVIAAVTAADGKVTASELAALRDAARSLELGAAEIGSVIAAAESPDSVIPAARN